MAKSSPRKVKISFSFALGSQPKVYHFSEPPHCWLPPPSALELVQCPVNVLMGGWWVAVDGGEGGTGHNGPWWILKYEDGMQEMVTKVETFYYWNCSHILNWTSQAIINSNVQSNFSISIFLLFFFQVQMDIRNNLPSHYLCCVYHLIKCIFWINLYFSFLLTWDYLTRCHIIGLARDMSPMAHTPPQFPNETCLSSHSFCQLILNYYSSLTWIVAFW